MFKNLQKSGWAILAIWFNLLALSAWSYTPDNNYMVRRSITADPITITGKVTSPGEGNIGLPGVSVYLKGTTTGTITDSEGNYTINLPDGSGTLVFSFIGYTLKEEVINGRTSINVGLKQDIQTLDEVVVVGYGTVSRKDLTTAVSSLNARQIKDIPINSAAQAIAGRLAGVQVVTSEGSPNAEVQIRVRGGGSITQNNNPIYVVDGIQVENALSVLAPQDIESIDVLKDASATAIYGARGANGVVIITTKGGKEMKTTVTYNGLIGVKKLANKLDVMKPYDFVLYQYDRSRSSSALAKTFLEDYGTYDDIELYRQVPFTDWQEEIFGRNAMMQTHNISLAGGSAATQFNLSLSSNTEQGIMLGSDFDRKILNFRFDHKITKMIKAGFNVRYNNTVVNGAGTSNDGSSSVNRLRQSIKYRPLLMPGQTIDSYDQDYADETSANSLSLVNPILLNKAEYRKEFSSVANLSGYVSIDLTKFLTVKSTLGFDISTNKINSFYDSITNVSKQNDRKPMLSIQTQPSTILNNSNVITFAAHKLSESFALKNKLDILVGHEVYQINTRKDSIGASSFPSGISVESAFGNLSLGTPAIPVSRESLATMLSFFSRLNYSYYDKYLIALTLRRDGSSKFAEGKKWGYFPSASLAWKVLNEDFMKSLESLQNVISDLKFRASYGQSGNNRIDDFMYLPQFVPTVFYEQDNNIVTGYKALALANSNLKWETTISRNIGLDASFFNNRAQISVDFYRNTTKDLLIRAKVPSTSGYTTQFQNIGSTSNQGIELQISGVPIEKKDFSWNVNFNISFNKNKVESLGGQPASFYNSGWATANDFVLQEGKPVGMIWGFKTDGFYTVDDFNYENGKYTLKDGVVDDQSVTGIMAQPGVIKFKDIYGDGIINDDDRTVLGTATPDFFGGLNQQLTYKNFDASVFVNFQYGNDVLNANKLEFTSGYTPNSNLLSMMNDRWRNVDDQGNIVTDPDALKLLNANAKLWMPLTNALSFNVHSWAVEDASFIRINNVTIGYSVPSTLLNKVKITKFRIYATANNLAVFSKYSGYDPDVNTRRRTPITPGVDYSAYPRSHSYIFGVNLTF